MIMLASPSPGEDRDPSRQNWRSVTGAIYSKPGSAASSIERATASDCGGDRLTHLRRARLAAEIRREVLRLRNNLVYCGIGEFRGLRRLGSPCLRPSHSNSIWPGMINAQGFAMFLLASGAEAW
jgi:hypothetical protein